jgi:hypothetical protein
MTEQRRIDLLNRIDKSDENRSRVFGIFKRLVLTLRDGKTNPVYLIRYSLFSCPWFSVKLHRIFLSDDDCMHDHPWSFLSIILWGGYFEHKPFVMQGYTQSVAIGSGLTVKKWHRAGSILWRPAPSIHKLEIPEGKSATTLVVTFAKRYNWGFYTPSGWKIWYQYVRSGAKCE